MSLLEYTGMDWETAFSAVEALILLAMGIYAWKIPQGKRFWLLGIPAAGLTLAAVWIPPSLWRILLLDAAALAAAALFWSQDAKAGRLYLAAVLAGAILAGIGLGMVGLLGNAAVEPAGAQAKIALALIITGFAFKLALLPFGFWLPAVAEKSSAMSAVLVISLVDMAELGELAAIRTEAPWIFSQAQWLWITLALLAMFGGAFLALAQTNLRRMLAFSTIDDMGYLILGLAAGSTGGVLGTMLGALSHAGCKFVLFGSLGVAEADLDRPVTMADRGLAGRYPAAAAAFIAGALGMIGVPPFMGFLGRWRLYLAGIEVGGAALGLIMAAATALALLYYVRAIHRVWLGKAEEAERPAPQMSRWLWMVMALGIALPILAGLFPAILPGLAGR